MARSTKLPPYLQSFPGFSNMMPFVNLRPQHLAKILVSVKSFRLASKIGKRSGANTTGSPKSEINTGARLPFLAATDAVQCAQYSCAWSVLSKWSCTTFFNGYYLTSQIDEMVVGHNPLWTCTPLETYLKDTYPPDNYPLDPYPQTLPPKTYAPWDKYPLYRYPLNK